MFYYADNQRPKVFGIGLSRTGTTSLNAALIQLGYDTIHWRINPERRLVSIEDCYHCDGMTDINASYNFELLLRVFPNAKFVYTTRPMEDWVDSMRRHYDCAFPAQLRKRLRRTPVIEPPEKAPREMNQLYYHVIHHALYCGYESWEAAYLAHEERVRQQFEKIGERLLEFDIFQAGHGWPELCTFLGCPVPENDYPKRAWHNETNAN